MTNEIQRATAAGKLITRLPEAYKGDVERFLRFSGGTITPEAVEDYFKHLSGRGYRPASIQRIRAAIKKAVYTGMGEGATLAEAAQLDSFFKRVKTPRPVLKVHVEKCLTPGELRRLVEKCGYKTALIARALYQTACRASELVSIKLSDCERRPEGVMIRIIGKGRKERFVFMRPETFDAIHEAYQGKIWLFESGGKPLSRFTITHMIKAAGKKIGRGDIHAHILRLSWATINVDALGLAPTAGYLGHSDTAVTAKYYLHGSPQMGAVLRESVI